MTAPGTSPTLSTVIRHLCVGARIREVNGHRRFGTVTAFDLDDGYINAIVDLQVVPSITNQRFTNPRYPLSGQAKIKITIREVIRGEWVIEGPTP